MSISVDFYKCSDDYRTMNKTMTAVGSSTTLQPLDPISDLEVKMLINYQAELLNANYFNADGKYYKITGRSRVPAQAQEIIGMVDVLKTYNDSIRTCNAICVRSDQQYNSDYPDSDYMREQSYDIQRVELGSLDKYESGLLVPDSIYCFFIP